MAYSVTVNLIPYQPSYLVRFFTSRLFIIVLTIVSLLTVVSAAIAADLTWGASTTLSMSEVGFTTITVASGSQATSLTVGTATITVTVPTGSAFTLNASSNITFSNTGGLSTTCGDTSSLVVTGPVTGLVITPQNTACAVAGRSAATTDPTPPPAPINVKASATSSSVTLAWTDPVVSDFSTIVILRNSGGNTPVSGISHAMVAKGKQTYTDTNVTAGETYKYYVRSRDSNGNTELNEKEIIATVLTTEATIPLAEIKKVAEPTPSVVKETPKEETVTETPETISVPEKKLAEVIKEVAVEIPVRQTPVKENIANNVQTITTGDTTSIAQAVGKTVNTKIEQAIQTEKKIAAILTDVSEKQKTATIGFISYGTTTTEALGIGERAGVLNSYKAAYNKLPETSIEWEDIIRLGAGQAPAQENLAAEQRAVIIFKQIYKRTPQIVYSADSTSVLEANEGADQKAIQMAAYGVRPSSRDLDKERSGIGMFKGIFGREPVSASDWDTVRMIAYSGAR